MRIFSFYARGTPKHTLNFFLKSSLLNLRKFVTGSHFLMLSQINAHPKIMVLNRAFMWKKQKFVTFDKQFLLLNNICQVKILIE